MLNPISSRRFLMKDDLLDLFLLRHSMEKYGKVLIGKTSIVND